MKPAERDYYVPMSTRYALLGLRAANPATPRFFLGLYHIYRIVPVSYMNIYAAAPAAKTRFAASCVAAAALSEEVEEAPSDSVAAAKPV